MTPFEALVEEWRVLQLAAYQRAHAYVGPVPLPERTDMREATVFARCANQLEAAIRQSQSGEGLAHE